MLRKSVMLKFHRVGCGLAGVAAGEGGYMDSQHNCAEQGKVVEPLAKKPYAEPVLVALGSFSELTMTVGSRGNNDGGKQSGRKSTRY